MTNLKTNKTDCWKLLLKIVAITLVIISLTSFLFACSNEPLTDEGKIEQRIELFMTAYNDGDMEEAMNHLAAKPRNAMKAMLNLLGGIAGSQIGFDIDLKDLFSLGVNMSDDDFMKLKIKDIIIIDSENAVAITTMNLTGAGVGIIYFKMVYEHDGWFISDMTDKKPSSLDKN